MNKGADNLTLGDPVGIAQVVLHVGRDLNMATPKPIVSSPAGLHPKRELRSSLLAHLAVVEGLVEFLSRRHTGVVSEEFAVSKDGMEMFAVIDLETSFDGCRFTIGIRCTSGTNCVD
jgi:hypothetical protein